MVFTDSKTLQILLDCGQRLLETPGNLLEIYLLICYTLCCTKMELQRLNQKVRKTARGSDTLSLRIAELFVILVRVVPISLASATL